jgi:hypothetical protein
MGSFVQQDLKINKSLTMLSGRIIIDDERMNTMIRLDIRQLIFVAVVAVCGLAVVVGENSLAFGRMTDEEKIAAMGDTPIKDVIQEVNDNLPASQGPTNVAGQGQIDIVIWLLTVADGMLIAIFSLLLIKLITTRRRKTIAVTQPLFNQVKERSE